VVHKTLIADALAAGANDDGAINGALKSLSLSLGGADAAPAVDTDQLTAKAMESARPVLVKLFGEEFFTPKALPAKLAELAENRGGRLIAEPSTISRHFRRLRRKKISEPVP